MLNNVFWMHRFPRNILSDRGCSSGRRSDSWLKLRWVCIEITILRLNRERLNQELETGLCYFQSRDSSRWLRMLLWFEYTIKTLARLLSSMCLGYNLFSSYAKSLGLPHVGIRGMGTCSVKCVSVRLNLCFTFYLKILLCRNPHVLSSFLPSCVIVPLRNVFQLCLIFYPQLVYLSYVFLSFCARWSFESFVGVPALYCSWVSSAWSCFWHWVSEFAFLGYWPLLL